MKPMPAWRKAPGLSPEIFLTRDTYFAAAAAIYASSGSDEFALTFALNSGKPDDFAGAHNKIHLVEAAPAESANFK